MDKKMSSMASSMKPMAPGMEDQATKSAHAGTVGVDKSDGIHIKLNDTMTKIPKLPGAHPAVPMAHAHNSAMHASRFGTDTEKAKVKSDVAQNYGGSSDDCPIY